MIDWINSINQRICKHDWKPSKFQMLTDNNSISCQCVKYGKIQQMFMVDRGVVG